MNKKTIAAYKKMSPERLTLHLHNRKRAYVSKNAKAYKRHAKHRKRDNDNA